VGSSVNHREKDFASPIRAIVFAGGGTGGHLYPGLALSEQICRIAPSIKTFFLCSTRSIDAEILSAEHAEFRPIGAEPLQFSPFPRASIQFIQGWRRATSETSIELDRLMNEFGGIDRIVVVLMGGFVAPPVARSASKRGIRTLLVNLDVVPGKANRLAARWASEVVSAVPCTGPQEFTKAPVLGMPVRANAVADDGPENCRARLGLSPDVNTLLVTGASQGAASLNELMLVMVRSERFRRAFDGWQILHLAGPGREADLLAIYKKKDIPAVVLPFCHSMGDAWGSADLALSRAGASSVAESALNGVPTIFVPYPWHRDEHQKHNAQPIVDHGGGWLVRDEVNASANLETIGCVLSDLLTHSNRRRVAKDRLLEARFPNAAVAMARRVLELK